MIDLSVLIYTLESLAEKEGVKYGYLRVMINRLQKLNKPVVWRDYKLFKVGNGKMWLAAHSDCDVEII